MCRHTDSWAQIRMYTRTANVGVDVLDDTSQMYVGTLCIVHLLSQEVKDGGMSL